MNVDWNQYTANIGGATMTKVRLLQRTAVGATIDLGCGLGKHLVRLENAEQKVGLDPGATGLQKGKSMFPELRLNCGSIYNLPFAAEVFDSAIMIDVIEHLNDPLAALKEARRVLKSDGLLFLQTPNYPVKRLYDFWHWMKKTRSRFEDDPTHFTKFNHARLIAVASRAGFSIATAEARNVFFDAYFPSLRQLHSTRLGLIVGQKLIIIAKKLSKQ